MKKGSITVFSALCMSFVFSALFVLLEAARFYGLSQYADWKGRQGVECVAAEYQPYLWEEFHLLMLDGGYSTDSFEIGNVTEQPGSQSFVTGTITNLTESTVDSVSLSMIMRKEDKIVFMEESYVGDLRPGTPAAFQFDRYSAWPEHDAVEFSAQAW